MEISLIKKDKKDWTRFKLTLKEFSELRGLLVINSGLIQITRRRKVPDLFTLKKREIF